MGSMKRSIPTLLLTLAILAGLAASASAQELIATRDAAVKQLVTDLESLADWCHESKLFKSRDLCYETVLEVAPNDETARARLGYTRRGDDWQRGRYHEPGNYDEELEAQFTPKFRELLDRFTSTLLDALEAADPKKEPQARHRCIAEVIAVDPDNLRARRLGGEDRLNGRWVLLETARALKRRDELRDLAKETLDSIPDPKPDTPTGDEQNLGIPFKATLVGQRWRGLATTSESELRRAVRTLDAVAPFWGAVFHTGTATGSRGKTFYLLSNQQQAETALKKHPAYDDARRKRDLALKASWVPGQHVFFQWNDSPQLRLDGATRNAIGIHVMKSFGMTTQQGWAWEGVGLYLDYLLTGSRRTIFVSSGVYTTTENAKKLDIERRMKSPGADWMALAREMLDAGVEPDLRTMMLRDVNEMNAEDLIYSHAFVSYLIEGCPDKATHFFVMQGSDRSVADTVRIVFDLAYPDFEKRFERWLREVTDLG